MSASAPTSGSRGHFWKISFLLLVVAPFLPEITIFAAGILAKLMGCQLDQKTACLIGSIPVSNIIAFALRLGAGSMVAGWTHGTVWFILFCAAVTLWILICFVALTLGWSRTSSRLLLGLVVALVFAVLPYFGPLLAIGNLLNKNCQPNEGGVGPCIMFGGHVGSPAHQAVEAGWVILAGAPIALGAFAVYTVVALLIRSLSRKHPVIPAQ
jgi:hypothetical protein